MDEQRLQRMMSHSSYTPSYTPSFGSVTPGRKRYLSAQPEDDRTSQSTVNLWEQNQYYMGNDAIRSQSFLEGQQPNRNRTGLVPEMPITCTSRSQNFLDQPNGSRNFLLPEMPIASRSQNFLDQPNYRSQNFLLPEIPIVSRSRNFLEAQAIGNQNFLVPEMLVTTSSRGQTFIEPEMLARRHNFQEPPQAFRGTAFRNDGNLFEDANVHSTQTTAYNGLSRPAFRNDGNLFEDANVHSTQTTTYNGPSRQNYINLTGSVPHQNDFFFGGGSSANRKSVLSAKQYRTELEKQIEENKAEKLKRKQKEKEEDEKQMQRMEAQRQRMLKEIEEEQKKKRLKEQEIQRQRELMMQAQADLQRELKEKEEMQRRMRISSTKENEEMQRPMRMSSTVETDSLRPPEQQIPSPPVSALQRRAHRKEKITPTSSNGENEESEKYNSERNSPTRLAHLSQLRQQLKMEQQETAERLQQQQKPYIVLDRNGTDL